MAEAKLIRVTKSDGTVHIVPATNRAILMQKNSALLRGGIGGPARPELQSRIEDLTEEEHREYYDNFYAESAALATKNKPVKAQPQGVSEAVVLELMTQNKALAEQLASMQTKTSPNGKGKKTVTA